MKAPLSAAALCLGLALAAAGQAYAVQVAAGQATDAPGATRAPRNAQGVGVVTEIDAKEGMVTVKHEPIPALGWPSMTMPFKVTPPSLLQGLKVGQKIAFDTNEGNGLPLITAIRKR